MVQEEFPFHLPSPFQKIDYFNHLPELWMKRDDLIHPVVSGNKWRKLKGFFQDCDKSKTVLTFGGAFSNHLPAASFALKYFGMHGVMIVRGEELNERSNPYLSYCAAQGMQLHFVSRSEYRALRARQWQPTQEQSQRWNVKEFQVLPEGGAGVHAIQGCGEIWSEIYPILTPKHLVLAAGTATTALGILHAMPANSDTQLHVVSAVKGAKKEQELATDLAYSKNITLSWIDETSFGGFGRVNDVLLDKKTSFTEKTAIPIDRNYNAKVLNYLSNVRLNGTVVWLNTGGYPLFERL